MNALAFFHTKYVTVFWIIHSDFKQHFTEYYSYNSLTLFLTTEISTQICDKSLLWWIYGIIMSKSTSN